MNRRDMLAQAGAGWIALIASPLAASSGQAGQIPDTLAITLKNIATSQRLAGAAVAIGREGKLIGSWRFGKASLQHAVPVANDTLFGAASVAKHVTATGILQLVDAGRVKLDASIGEYLAIVPPTWRGRTVRSLLNHTSGLPDYTLAPKVMPGGDEPTRAQMIERMRFREPLFETGQGWSYCNSNYLMLGWIIEDATGKPLSEAMRDTILRPAGALRARADGLGVVTPNLAESYVFDQRYWRIPFEQSDVAQGSGTMQWSIDDIAPWGDALLSHRRVSRAMTSEGLRWARLSSGIELPYGFGFFLDRVAGRPIHWHNGGSPGTVAMFLQLPAEELTVGVMANTDAPTRTMRSMAWEAVRAVSPGAGYFDRAAMSADALDTRLAALACTPGPLQPDPSFIAPDFLRVLQDATEQRRFNPGFRKDTRLERIEEYKVGTSTMRRYRVIHPDAVDYKLAGFDAAGRLFWLWGC
jgi:D-alanyl-D-alanine carboxypeptidase